VSVVPVPLKVSDSDPTITPSNVVPLVNVTFNIFALLPEVIVPLPEIFDTVTVPVDPETSKIPFIFTLLLACIAAVPIRASVFC
jgi:hypothetical protein